MNLDKDTAAGGGPGGSPLDAPRHKRMVRLILGAILVTMFVSGLVTGIAEERRLPEPAGWTLVAGLLSNFLTFFWFRLDRDARGVRRSVWANVAILLFEPLAIIVYVLVSRPRGEKLRGFGRLFGFFLLIMLATTLGMALAFGVA